MRQQLEALLLAAFVDGAQDVQQLAADWCVASERDAAEFVAEGVGGAVSCQIDEAIFEYAVRVVVYPDVGVQFAVGAPDVVTPARRYEIE